MSETVAEDKIRIGPNRGQIPPELAGTLANVFGLIPMNNKYLPEMLVGVFKQAEKMTGEENSAADAEQIEKLLSILREIPQLALTITPESDLPQQISLLGPDVPLDALDGKLLAREGEKGHFTLSNRVVNALKRHDARYSPRPAKNKNRLTTKDGNYVYAGRLLRSSEAKLLIILGIHEVGVQEIKTALTQLMEDLEQQK